jgi:hypothetical protein
MGTSLAGENQSRNVKPSNAKETITIKIHGSIFQGCHVSVNDKGHEFLPLI